MKKSALFFFFCLAGIGCALACTNLIVTKGASADGSVMVTYAADSHQLFGELYFRPAADYAPGTLMDVNEWDTGRFLGRIPQAAHTYKVIGNMNEHQLIIGETTFGGRHECVDTTAIVDYGTLIYTALQRCRTAREAIALIDELTQTYGYASEGESFSIADTEEAWVMEIMCKVPKFNKKGVNVNKGSVWVAKRIPDGQICAHANQARITTIDFNDPENCLYSKDVITHAREQGFFDGTDAEFSFCDVYAPLDFSGARGCEARVWSFFRRFAEGMEVYQDYAMGYDPTNHMPLSVTPSRKITVKDMADMMRDHYEGTPMDMTVDAGAGGSHCPYRWRPMDWKYEGKEYVNERAIATQQTGWWYVAQARAWNEAGIFWFGVDDAATSPLFPLYTTLSRSPECIRQGNGTMLEYSETSMFWMVNRIAQFAYLRYDRIGAEVRDVIDRYEKNLMENVTPAIDRTPAAVQDEFSLANADRLFATWKALDRYLLVKYIDGNIKRQNPDGSFQTNGFSETIPAFPVQEDYSDVWKKAVVESNGKVLEVK